MKTKPPKAAKQGQPRPGLNGTTGKTPKVPESKNSKSSTTTTKPPAKPADAGDKPRRSLNIRQERFAELVASGVPATTAYRQAGYTQDGRIAEAHASRLVDNGGVKSRISELRKPDTRKSVLTLADKREFCREVVKKADAKMSDRLRALEIDAKLAGHFAPEKVEVEDGPNRLQSIRERAAEVARAMDRNARLRSSPTAPPNGNGNGNGHHDHNPLSRWMPNGNGNGNGNGKH